jgi:signal transduction histidine kinase
VVAGVRDYVVALRGLAAFWATVGARPVEEWRANAELLIESFPALAYVAWIHPDGRRHRVAVGKTESPADVEIEPSEIVTWGAEPNLVGPERDDSGAIGFRVFLPVRRDGAELGVLEARVNTEPMLADLFQDGLPGYAIHVRWKDDVLFRRGEPSPDPALDWWRIEGPASLILGATWTVTLAPTPELAAAWLTPDPHYLLAVGIALAIALGLLANELRTSLVRVRSLAAGNRALETSGEELRRLNETLEARVAERTAELETLTQLFAHDLKSPLGAILNFAEIIDVDHRDRLDPDGRDILARIRRSAIRATGLLDGLLRLSRARRATLDMTDIDMNALARESFAQARVSAADHDVEFVLEPLPNARGDRGLVAEALVNLFDNALKYSRGREKGRVMMRGRLEGGECVYEVSDNGQGFDMQYSGKLFGVFERLHTSPEIPGIGVGLALVKKIVQRHAGRVWAEGTIDGGARFAFTLPPVRATP